MTPTREELAAWADGEVEGPRAAEIAAAVAADPELAREVAAHGRLKDTLSTHYAPIAANPVPERFTALLEAGRRDPLSSAAVIDLAGARSARRERGIPRWGWVVGPALAASIVLLVTDRPAQQPANGYADTALASALDTRLAADPVSGGEPRVLLSFARAGGEMCRAWAAPGGSGIACRDSNGWRIERRAPGIDRAQADYRQAGNPIGDLMSVAQDMAGEGAFDRAQEEAARDRGWR